MGKSLTSAKAKEILKDGTAHKKALTKKQISFFQAVAHGMKPYQEGGSLPYYQDPEFIYKDRFNTPLSVKERAEFDKWTAKNPRALGDMGAYDIQGFWKSGDYLKIDAQGHGSDRWKKPNHPTFSNESIYNKDGFHGGSWGADGSYYPTKQTRQLYDEEY